MLRIRLADTTLVAITVPPQISSQLGLFKKTLLNELNMFRIRWKACQMQANSAKYDHGQRKE